MRVLLDTVAFLFAIENPDRLSRTARAVLREPANQRELSVVSLAEVAMKNDAAEAHVLQLMTLPVHHRDPFDRMLIAQALAEDVRVMTCDKEFRKYKGLEVIW